MIPTEHQEQKDLFRWVSAVQSRYPHVVPFAIPNGGDRHVAVGRKLKAEGVRPGVPDIFLPVPTEKYHGLFIEMKRRKGSSVSLAQKAWMDVLNRHGYKAVIAKGWEQGATAIVEYLRLPATYRP
jgi:hypothetical protein